MLSSGGVAAVGLVGEVFVLAVVTVLVARDGRVTAEAVAAVMGPPLALHLAMPESSVRGDTSARRETPCR